MPRHEILSHTQIEQRIRSHFQVIEDSRGTLDRLNSAMLPLWQELSSKTPGGRHRYTAYTRGFARGVHDALWHTLMQEKVEFVYRIRQDLPEINAKRDELFSTHKQSVHRLTEEFYEAGIGIKLNDAYYSHVWKGTDKPIGAWSVPRSNMPSSGKLPGIPAYKVA